MLISTLTRYKLEDGCISSYLINISLFFQDMIHIADTKVAPRYGDYFLRQIYRFDELYRVVSGINV